MLNVLCEPVRALTAPAVYALAAPPIHPWGVRRPSNRRQGQAEPSDGIRTLPGTQMADPTGTPTRIPGFYERVYRAAENTDELTCRECRGLIEYDHDDVPAVGELVPCFNCGLLSRVPALPSQAGMAEPIDPPHNRERS